MSFIFLYFLICIHSLHFLRFQNIIIEFKISFVFYEINLKNITIFEILHSFTNRYKSIYYIIIEILQFKFSTILF